MNKKLLALTLVIISMLTLLTACSGSTQNETTPKATTAPAVSEVEFATIEVIPATITNAEDQFKLIAEKLSTWKHKNFDTTGTPEAFKYAVTDLDNNGRLEIISAACTGSAYATSAFIYEVNEGLTDLTTIHESSSMSEDIEPDFIVDSTECYINPETMERFYAYSNSHRFEGEEILLTKGYFSLNDGLMDKYWLITKTVKSDGSYSYKDCEDFSLNEEQFNSYIDNYYAGYAKCTATFGWNNFANAEGVIAADLAKDELVNNLKTSFAEFSVK